MNQNNWVSGSAVVGFIHRMALNSVSGRVIGWIMSIWDSIISKSMFVAWLTGRELGWRPLAHKRGILGGFVFSCWSRFLGFLRILFGENSAFQRSFFVFLTKSLSRFALDLPFVAFGLFGAGFFGSYGILKMTVVGVSVNELIIIISCFAVLVLIMLIRVPWSKLIETSWFISRLQEIDD